MAINTRNDFYTNLANGKGIYLPYRTQNTGTSTTAGATGPTGSGSFSVEMHTSLIGTTFPSTLQTLLLPPGLANQTIIGLVNGVGGSSTGRAWYICYFYKVGTLVLTSTGNQFTHDAATFPVTRTQFGAATKPLSLMPILNVTTATTTTAAAFILKNTAPSAGYTNQDGNAITGTKTFTMPAAATAVNSCFVLRLEEGDSAVQDITQIDITTAASAGAATIWLVEFLSPIGNAVSQMSYVADHLLGGVRFPDLRPASPTSGSLTSVLGLISFGQTAANVQCNGLIQAALAA